MMLWPVAVALQVYKMKKLILIFLLLFCTTACAQTDRVSVKIEFRKAYWTCPKCEQEDFTDLNVGTPSVYEHNCSKCGAWSNSFKEYNGILSYPKDEYEKVKQEDIDKEKKDRCDAWICEIKNPPPYIEPTKAELEVQKAELEKQITEIQGKIDAKNITPIND